MNGVVGRAPRKKTKQFTRRQLNRARVLREAEARTNAKQEAGARRRIDRQLQRQESAFKGCEVEK